MLKKENSKQFRCDLSFFFRKALHAEKRGKLTGWVWILFSLVLAREQRISFFFRSKEFGEKGKQLTS